mgnify:CR=1 FL=1
MKKIGFLFIFSMLVCTTVSAYNPPVNGESFMEYATPKLLSGSLSTAGGGIFTASPEAIVLNPALTATEQRADLNLAYTALFSTSSISKEMNSVYGNIIQSSIFLVHQFHQDLIIQLSSVPGRFIIFLSLIISIMIA